MLALLLAHSPPGQAQDAAPGTLEVTGSFETEWHEVDNLDFRPLDESADQRILDSDDRTSFAFTGASLELAYRIDDHVGVTFGASHRGLWGNDQLGSVNRYGGWIYVPSLYTDIELGSGEARPGFRVGRQRFELGGLGGARDYVLDDTLDMVRFDLPLPGLGRVILVPVNVVSKISVEDDADFIGLMGPALEQHFNMRGDVITRRHGLVIQADELGPVDAAFYTFYTKIAGVQGGTGTDISYGGLLGNFSDNDWVLNGGIRGSVELGPVRPFLHLDGSNGIDRKEEVAQDVDTFGMAYGGGVVAETGDADDEDEDGLRAEVSYFEAWGPGYSKDGLQFSHGYVGMKGDQVGGALFDEFLGFHPTAYVSTYGVTDTPHDQSRKSGTRVVHLAGGYELPGFFGFGAELWWLQDTGFTELEFDRLDTITPPFGYSRAEFEAQERLGESIGTELDLSVRVEATDHADFFVQGATILPGAYYGIVVARIAGSPEGPTALGWAPDPAQPWTVGAGTQVRF